MLKLLRNLTISWGIFTCSQKQALHFWAGIRAATWWLLGEQATCFHSPCKGTFSQLKLPRKPCFANEKLFPFLLPEVQDTPRRGTNCRSTTHQQPFSRYCQIQLSWKKAPIHFLSVSGYSLPAPPSKIQVTIPELGTGDKFGTAELS